MSTAADPEGAVFSPGRSDAWSWIATLDHKRVGFLYGATAFGFLLIGGIEALVLRAQLAQPGLAIAEATVFNGLFTMHGTTMVFLAMLPLFTAFESFLVPLLIGARDVAFPRLNAFGYWTFLAGGLLLHGGFAQALFADGGLAATLPDAGWSGTASLATAGASSGPGLGFWAIGLLVVAVASLASAFNLVATILNMRAPGMTLARLPMFAWTALVAQILLVLTLPIVMVGLLLLVFDRQFGTHFYDPSAGADPLLWSHLFWPLGPCVYAALVLPAAGIVSEVLPVFSRKPLFGSRFVIYAVIAIGALCFAGWGQHLAMTETGRVADAAFSLLMAFLAIPLAVVIFDWIATIWSGHIILRTPMIFAVGFVALVVVGLLSGFQQTTWPVDLQYGSTQFSVAHVHYLLVGGALLGVFSGAYYWWPKWFGRCLNEGLGKLHFWLTFLSINAAFAPLFAAGVDGMPRRIYTYVESDGWDLANLVSSVGAFVLGASMLVFVWNAIRTGRSGLPAGNDPWDAATLEWSVPSPPPVHDFDRVPVVTSARPYWEMKYGNAPRPEPGRQEHIATPGSSIWPAVCAAGIFAFGLGFVIAANPVWPVSIVGAGTFALGVWVWLIDPFE